MGSTSWGFRVSVSNNSPIFRKLGRVNIFRGTFLLCSCNGSSTGLKIAREGAAHIEFARSHSGLLSREGVATELPLLCNDRGVSEAYRDSIYIYVVHVGSLSRIINTSEQFSILSLTFI